MLEQEVASIARLILDITGKPASYFHNIPEQFVTPSVYFPSPEIESDGDTATTYRLDYSWYIMIFAKTSEEAYGLGQKVVNTIRAYRNAVPCISVDGSASGSIFRIKDPQIKMADNGACRLYIRWTSRRSYHVEDAQLVQYFELEGWKRPDVYKNIEAKETVATDYETFVSNYPKASKAGSHPEVATEGMGVSATEAIDIAATVYLSDYPRPQYAGQYPKEEYNGEQE